MTRQTSEPVIWKDELVGAWLGAATANGVWPTGRGNRMGVVVGNVVMIVSFN